MKKTLYVGNFASHEDAGAVEHLLSGYGKVLRCKVMAYDDFVRRHGGFAVAEMESEQQATNAIRALQGSTFRGNRLTVRAATAAEETTAGRSHKFSTMNMGDETELPKRKQGQG